MTDTADTRPPEIVPEHEHMARAADSIAALVRIFFGSFAEDDTDESAEIVAAIRRACYRKGWPR